MGRDDVVAKGTLKGDQFMSLKLIKDRIFPNCNGKTDHFVSVNFQYLFDDVGIRYMVFL